MKDTGYLYRNSRTEDTWKVGAAMFPGQSAWKRQRREHPGHRQQRSWPVILRLWPITFPEGGLDWPCLHTCPSLCRCWWPHGTEAGGIAPQKEERRWWRNLLMQKEVYRGGAAVMQGLRERKTWVCRDGCGDHWLSKVRPEWQDIIKETLFCWLGWQTLETWQKQTLKEDRREVEGSLTVPTCALGDMLPWVALPPNTTVHKGVIASLLWGMAASPERCKQRRAGPTRVGRNEQTLTKELPQQPFIQVLGNQGRSLRQMFLN